MSDGDDDAGTDASAIGLAIMTGLEKVWTLWRFVNSTRDMLADHITSGSHSAEQITSGQLDPARLPTTIPVANIPSGIPASKVNGHIWDGPVVAGSGTIENSGAVIFQSVYANVLSTSYRAAYIQSNGTMGTVPSSRRYKRAIKKMQRDGMLRILDANVVEFDYIKRLGGGHDTGLIAEDLAKLGLDFLVIRDEKGRPDGIHYERLGVPLLAVVQQQQERLNALERRLDEGAK